MKNKQQILRELYALDPELKKREEELLRIIDKFLEDKPNPAIDKEFVQELRSQLLKEARNRKQTASKFAFFFSPKIYSPVLATAVILLIASVFLWNDHSGNQKPAYNKQQIEIAENNAFGSLTEADIESMDTEGRGSASFGADGGGQLNVAEESMEADGDTPDSRMIRSNLINYEFRYAGDDISLENIDSGIYRRIKQGLADSDFSQNIISQLDTGLLDVSEFDSATVNNIDIRQDREFGYSIYLNLEEGVAGINKNWEKWPSPKIDCQGGVCSEPERIKPEDVPADKEIIDVAEKFINKYGLDTSNYGKPQVMRNWEKSRDLSPNSSDINIPEEVPVVFPLVIKEKQVHEQSGEPYGLAMEVNIKHNKVAGVRNLVAQKFQASEYENINNPDKIIDMAEKGGLGAPHEHADPDKTVTITLGTPEKGLTQIMKRGEQGNQQLFVPALIFPITDRSEQTHFTREHIVVPATKELFEQEWKKMNNDGAPTEPGEPEILPHPRN
ncbi:MAG: hypothetical protein ACOCVY_01700 [Patescibacteria group bacterium]